MPATTTCQACQLVYGLGPGNAIAHTFWEGSEFAWLQSICERCHNENKQFLGKDYEANLEMFTEMGIAFVLEDAPDMELLRQYDEVYDSHKAKDELLCRFFRYLLEEGEQPHEPSL